MEAKFVIKESPKLSRNNQKRFIVEEIETGKVVLDANGYGYKNPGNALKVWDYLFAEEYGQACFERKRKGDDIFMRKLASIQKISDICPIKGADRIELVKVLGWQCVAKKGEFQKGDLCVYFEVDSLLPIRPEFEFLRPSSYTTNEVIGEGFRLRTQKFRGQISQGLCLPMSFVDEAIRSELSEGTDVTELFGVRKFEMPEMATSDGTIIGSLPSNVPHTDETRIQSKPELLQEFSGKPYYITTKIDGSSHSVSMDADGFHVMSHNCEYKDDGKYKFYEMVKSMGLPEKLQEYLQNNPATTSIVIQGEYAGPGIQKNRLKLKEPHWYVFDIRINQKRVPLTILKFLCKALELEMVPIEEVGVNLPSKYPTIEDLLKRAEGQYPTGGPKEGIVVRTCVPVYSPIIDTDLSMKIINNKYLLKNKD